MEEQQPQGTIHIPPKPRASLEDRIHEEYIRRVNPARNDFGNNALNVGI